MQTVKAQNTKKKKNQKMNLNYVQQDCDKVIVKKKYDTRQTVKYHEGQLQLKFLRRYNKEEVMS